MIKTIEVLEALIVEAENAAVRVGELTTEDSKKKRHAVCAQADAAHKAVMESLRAALGVK